MARLLRGMTVLAHQDAKRQAAEETAQQAAVDAVERLFQRHRMSPWVSIERNRSKMPMEAPMQMPVRIQPMKTGRRQLVVQELAEDAAEQAAEQPDAQANQHAHEPLRSRRR